jgi:hypothetical protein
MGDGANMGITAHRALGTIIGGDPNPDAEERQDRAAVKARLVLAPDPCTGPKIWERVESGEIGSDDAYSLAADCIAKAFLFVILDQTELLNKDAYYDADEMRAKGHDEESVRIICGQPRDRSSVLWDGVMKRWPDFDDWVGGASGFQVGFAYSTIRFLYDEPYEGNPAIMEIG